MKKEIILRLLPHEADNDLLIKGLIAKQMKVAIQKVNGYIIRRRSIDARKNPVMVQLHINAWANTPVPLPRKIEFIYPDVANAQHVIIVGTGPGGLFAALRLIEMGLKPIIIERGKNVGERKKDIAQLNRNNPVNPESNYAFGEGGAGTFSDGKLYTRNKKKGDFERFLEILHFHGANHEILIDSHPHIGTDKLPSVIVNIRNTIIRSGGEILFNTRMDDIVIEGDEFKGIVTSTGDKILAKAVILATGHSAKDVYELLHSKLVLLEPKTWAMGVRVEHPQKLIDQIQYHSPQGRGKFLPAASYSFVCRVQERGVYSFCMCPGGFIVPAMTGPDEMVVNGMSASGRNSPFANSGMVVEIRPEDLKGYQNYGALAGLVFQKEVEKNCYVNGGNNIIAPAQRLTDFVNGRLSYDLPENSYIPGTVSAPLHFILPQIISERLREGFSTFGKWAKGFLTPDAIVVGTESRTSSPVRIPRDPFTYQHVQIKGLFPCGEGAGYAGGIASSAMDGEKCAEMVASFFKA